MSAGPLRVALVALLTMSFFSSMFFLVIPAIVLFSAGAPIVLQATLPGVLGALLLIASLASVVVLVIRFIHEGRGTPAPLSPPERLVRSGPYTWLRNPMYLAYVGVVLGEALLIRSWLIGAYAAVLLGLAHAYVVLLEEPALGRRFGDAYAEYCRRVPRWWPFARLRGQPRH